MYKNNKDGENKRGGYKKNRSGSNIGGTTTRYPQKKDRNASTKIQLPPDGSRMIAFGKNSVSEACKAGIAKHIHIRKGTNLYDVDFNAKVSVHSSEEYAQLFPNAVSGSAVEVVTPLLRSLRANTHLGNLVLVLDKVQDPQNFGAIIRAAYSFNFHSIIIQRHSQVKVTPTVFSASAGCVAHVKLFEVVNLPEGVETLSNLGYKIYSTASEGTNIDDITIPERAAVILGSEGKGVRSKLADLANEQITIPMTQGADSLNVSQAAAIAMHYFHRGNAKYTD